MRSALRRWKRSSSCAKKSAKNSQEASSTSGSLSSRAIVSITGFFTTRPRSAFSDACNSPGFRPSSCPSACSPRGRSCERYPSEVSLLLPGLDLVHVDRGPQSGERVDRARLKRPSKHRSLALAEDRDRDTLLSGKPHQLLGDVLPGQPDYFGAELHRERDVLGKETVLPRAHLSRIVLLGSNVDREPVRVELPSDRGGPSQ